MFNRIEIKTNAKNAIKHFYAWGLLASLIYLLLSGELGEFWSGFHGIRSIFNLNEYESQTFISEFSEIGGALQGHHGHYYVAPIGIVAMFLGGIFFILRFAIKLLYQIFVINVLEVGLYSFFLENRQRETNINEMIAPFQKKYLNVVKITFLKTLYLCLWTLLLVIPGIIKRYEYYFVPYLLAENPELTSNEAFQMSKTMTNGEKMNIFIFDLSFIGWLFLGSLLGGIGQVLVFPYIYAARSELYVCLKERKL